ncbi:MAG: metallophosphatase family protein [Gammaproteobacteria bacterium]|nr:metallophosphatase family protein [Gammaproteobacteria bacterium]MCW9087962.1 metallophosphatase family protein [Gammaproteobacteria bacterium]
MSTRIGLISDIHASVAPLGEALAIFAREQVSQILCPGDIAGYGEELTGCVALLQQAGVKVVVGNHDRWHVEDGEDGREELAFMAGLPVALSLAIAGKRLYLVHASPPDSDMGGIKLLDETGALIPSALSAWRERLKGLGHEVLVVGHTHQVFAEQLGDTLVINPGSTAFNHSCAILHLPECRVEWYAVGGEMKRVWNWGMGVTRRDE